MEIGRKIGYITYFGERILEQIKSTVIHVKRMGSNIR